MVICMNVDPDGGMFTPEEIMLVVVILWSADYMPRSKSVLEYSQSTGLCM